MDVLNWLISSKQSKNKIGNNPVGMNNQIKMKWYIHLINYATIKGNVLGKINDMYTYINFRGKTIQITDLYTNI